jgi:hypothetical protein
MSATGPGQIRTLRPRWRSGKKRTGRRIRTCPGGGPPAGEEGAASEGLPASYDDNYRMWDTLTDVRGSWFWGHADLDYNPGESLAYGCFIVPYDPNVTVFFVDAQYRTPILVRPIQERFSLSSEVTMPAGFVPSIRHGDCSLP